MRHRLVLLVSVVVAAAHGWVIFGPGVGGSFLTLALPATPSHVDAVWVSLPPLDLAPAASSTPVPPPTAPRKPRKKMVQRAAVQPVAPAAPSPAPSATSAVPASEPPDIAEQHGLETEPATHPTDVHAAPALPSGPRLQVHNSAGAAVDVALPTDGSALEHAMLLRFKVHGFVKGMEYHAHAELQWHTDGDTYHARQSISAFLLGSMEQTSSGRLTAQGLQPLQFTDRRFAKRRSVQLDWATQQATFDPAREAAPIGAGAQDRLSVFLQLAALLQAMPELRTPGTRIDIPTLGARRLQRWTFVVEQPELLELPQGPMHTLRLQRQSQAGDDEKALLWVNPTQGYVPVRIRMQERNGDVMDLSLKS